MSLERFRRTRMVVLNRRSSPYQAARAMADNHIGAVLVSDQSGITGIVTDRDLALVVLGGGLDPTSTTLDEVMSEEVVTCDTSASVDDIVRLMREHGVRRIPIMEAGRPVGLVTFDDLVVDGSVDIEALRGIVTAQLEVEAPQKPAGMLHPTASTTAQARTRALVRAKARAEATYGRMVQKVAEATGLDRDRAERALLIATSMLCRRLTPEEAKDLVAQLPSTLQPRLGQCLDGPDRSISIKTIEDEMNSSLGVRAEKASEVVRTIFRILSGSVSPGQMAEVRGQLPQEMKALFPAQQGDEWG